MRSRPRPARYAGICCIWEGPSVSRRQQQAGTIRAVLVEASRHPALNDALQHQFLDERKALIQAILQQAADRGEIDESVISDELWDLLPGYLIFRSIMPSRPATEHTVQALVDDVIIPSLTRKADR